MLHSFALNDVLFGLKIKTPGQTRELFNFVFEVATQALVETSRRVLDAFLFAGIAGTTLEHLSATTGLQASEVMEAIEDLVQRSLIEVSGTVEEKRYGVHRLTDTYLTSRDGTASQEISHLNLDYWLNKVKTQGYNLIRYESNNLYRAVERGILHDQLELSTKLLLQIQPGILSNFSSSFWLTFVVFNALSK